MKLRFARLAAGVIPAVALVAMALPASAKTGGTLHSAGQAGYAVTGAQVRYLTAAVNLPADGSAYASYLKGVGGSISLWAKTGDVVQLGISTATNAAKEPFSPGVAVFAADHSQAKDSMAHASWCPAGGSCAPASAGGSFAPGAQVTFSMYYNEGTGVVSMNERDKAGNLFHAWYRIGTGLSFTRAEVTSDFGYTPWDSQGLTGTAPAKAAFLAHWYYASMTAYNGHHASLGGSWWVAHPLVATGTSGAYAAPALPNSRGTAFNTELLP